MIAGGVMMIIGILSILIGRAASKKLKVLIRRIGNKNNLKEKFRKHDRDGDGYLSVYEFKNFVNDMNVGLNDDELTNAFLAIDRNNDRYITFSDLANWYATSKYEVKTDGVII
jgi:Ca2+-binding EF-hand superfamily protein